MQSVLKLLTVLDKIISKLIVIGIIFAVMVAVMPRRTGSGAAKPGRNGSRDFTPAHVTLSYWPTRNFDRWFPLPHSDSAFTAEEFASVKDLSHLLERGLTNRMNLEEALASRQTPENYLKFLDIFKTKQYEVLDALQALETPESLRHTLNRITEGTRSQITFYDTYARRKSSEPSTRLQDLSRDTDLNACHQSLWNAHVEFTKSFPQRKRATDQAIRARLSWMDIV